MQHSGRLFLFMITFLLASTQALKIRSSLEALFIRDELQDV